MCMNKNLFRIGKLSGKGSAALICLCLAAVAAAGVYTYNKSDLSADKEQLSGTSDSASPEAVLGAEAVQNDVPVAPAQESVPDAAADVMAENAAEADENSPEDAVNPPVDQTVPFESGDALTAGILVRPLDGEIICDYSDGELVKSPTLGVWKTHDGIDIAGEQGECVRSAAAGVVEQVYNDPVWGNCVIISHSGGYESYYFGLADDVDVSQGDSVNAGTEIGEVGNTADAEAAEPSHVHFGLKNNGEWIDPADALSGLGS